MSYQDDLPEQNQEYIFGGYKLRAKVISPEEKPIRYKVDGKTWVLDPTHPMYQVIKWYGEYEEV